MIGRDSAAAGYNSAVRDVHSNAETMEQRERVLPLGLLKAGSRYGPAVQLGSAWGPATACVWVSPVIPASAGVQEGAPAKGHRPCHLAHPLPPAPALYASVTALHCTALHCTALHSFASGQ